LALGSKETYMLDVANVTKQFCNDIYS
jgi:hypothetical protein